jgi:hypothetical protein
MATIQPLIDCSIEYCHIYTNEDISDEHVASIEALRTIVGNLRDQGATYSFCVMVDDYSFPETSPSFDYDRLLQWLAGQQAAPHFLVKEGSLVRAADEVIELIGNQRRKHALQNYIKRKRYPCSLFIAAWYLARLGKLRTIPKSEVPHARQLINILPARFEPFECEATDILSCTPYAGVVHAITNEYIGLRPKMHQSSVLSASTNLVCGPRGHRKPRVFRAGRRLC